MNGLLTALLLAPLAVLQAAEIHVGIKPGEPAVQLYILHTDPAETTNLAAQHPEKVKKLLSALQANVDRGRSR